MISCLGLVRLEDKTIRFQIQWFLLVLLVALISGCEPTTPEGYPYEIYKDQGLPPAKIGDEVLVYFEIRTSDTLLFASPQKSGSPAILVSPTLNRLKKNGPIADLLPLLGEGDSAVVRIPVEEDMRVAYGLETAEEIFYHVVVRKVNRAGSEDFGKTNRSSLDQKSNTERTAAVPDLRAKLKAAGKGIDQVRALGQFIGHVKAKNPALKRTENGLVYHILEPGQGDKLQADEPTQVNYLGSLVNGVIFAETYTNDLPFSFVYQQGRVIKAWDQSLDLVHKGGKLLLAVPPALAYGKIGKEPYIAPNDTLYYYLELLD